MYKYNKNSKEMHLLAKHDFFGRIAWRKTLLYKRNMAAWLDFVMLHLYKSQDFWINDHNAQHHVHISNIQTVKFCTLQPQKLGT